MENSPDSQKTRDVFPNDLNKQFYPVKLSYPMLRHWGRGLTICSPFLYHMLTYGTKNDQLLHMVQSAVPYVLIW